MANVSPKIKTEELSLPNFGASIQADLSNYRVRYLKADLNDPSSIGDLELIETKGLQGDEIVIIAKDKFTFMEKYFVIVTYLEKRE